MCAIMTNLSWWRKYLANNQTLCNQIGSLLERREYLSGTINLFCMFWLFSMFCKPINLGRKKHEGRRPKEGTYYCYFPSCQTAFYIHSDPCICAAPNRGETKRNFFLLWAMVNTETGECSEGWEKWPECAAVDRTSIPTPTLLSHPRFREHWGGGEGGGGRIFKSQKSGVTGLFWAWPLHSCIYRSHGCLLKICTRASSWHSIVNRA